MNVPINWLAIVVAVLLSMAIGFVWYAKPLFGKVWQKLVGLKDEDLKKGMAPAMISAVVFGFFMAYILRHTIVMSESFYHYGGLQTGLTTGFWLWLGIALPVLGVNYMFARRSWKLLAIDAGNMLVTLLAMGALLGAWV